MDRGTWQATAHGVSKSRTQLSNKRFPFHSPGLLPEEFHGQRSLAGYTIYGVPKSQT